MDAPNRASRTKAAAYEILVRRKVLAWTELDQTQDPDTWRSIGRVALRAADNPVLRVRRAPGPGLLYADAIYLESAARYNDGSPVREVVLEPFDGMLLSRR